MQAWFTRAGDITRLSPARVRRTRGGGMQAWFTRAGDITRLSPAQVRRTRSCPSWSCRARCPQTSCTSAGRGSRSAPQSPTHTPRGPHPAPSTQSGDEHEVILTLRVILIEALFPKKSPNLENISEPCDRNTKRPLVTFLFFTLPKCKKHG